MLSKLSTSSSSAISSKKRKHNSLTISKKLELLQKLEKGTSVLQLCNEYGVGKSTVYDLQKQKSKLLQFFSDSDTPLAMNKRKSIRPSNNEEIDKVMIEWVRQRRSENIPLTGSMITAQARIFHAEMKIESPCEYSSGWLEKFKKRHGIRQLRICGEKEGADTEAADFFVNKFCQLVADENLSLEQIYNADETSLFWRYVPKKTLATAEEKNPAGIKESKERLTVLACANAAGTHKNKLLIIGKHARPRALKNVKSLPAIYKANKRAWVTKELFTEWFNDNFIPEAKAHAKSTGLKDDAKILLIVDNCSAHPEILNKENFQILFLPPNCTSLIQPMDQGILRALKCRYKNDFLHRMLNFINKGKSICEFIKEYNIKDAIWCAANAWQNVNKDILRHGWRNLMPTIIFFDDEEEEQQEFEGFTTSKNAEMISNLLGYCKENIPDISLTADDIDEVIHADDDSPIIGKLTDDEIRRMALGEMSDTESESDDENKTSESKMPIDDIVNNLDNAIKGLEQRDFISEQEIMSLYKIKEKLVCYKRNSMKQLTINDMFKKKDNINQ